MAFQQPDSIRYFTFDSLEEHGITHAVFTRQGGVSPAPWSSLNVGGTVGDDPERVLENRRRSFQALGKSLESMYDVWQVHGIEVVCTEAPRPADAAHLRADAMLTAQPGVTLYMRFADCVPIFLYDPRRRVVGMVHAGWQGTVNRVASKTVQVMQARYNSSPGDILAGIGPSIGPHHYPVGPEVVQQVRQAFGADGGDLLGVEHRGNGRYGVELDLWRANRLILEQVGVSQIETAEICTACHLEDWYSHRGEGGRTGRFGALIAL
ncbi:MAG: peptidoglycan editing factor PgeF [Chloroflexota bacterium]